MRTVTLSHEVFAKLVADAAFAKGTMSGYAMSYLNDLPHGAFDNMLDAVEQLGASLDNAINSAEYEPAFPLEYIVTFKGEEYRLSEDEVASLLPTDPDAFTTEDELAFYEVGAAHKPLTFTNYERGPLSEEQRQREVAEILQKTDDIASESYKTGKLPDLLGTPVKRRPGRQPGFKPAPKVKKATVTDVDLRGTAIENPDFTGQPIVTVREFRPFGTHNRHADHQ